MVTFWSMTKLCNMVPWKAKCYRPRTAVWVSYSWKVDRSCWNAEYSRICLAKQNLHSERALELEGDARH
jgi:hypothetical protein